MSKQRLSVSLRPQELELITRLAWYRKVSRSRIVAELVESSAEPLQRIATILELAEKANASYKRDMSAVVGNAAKSIDELYRQALDQVEVVQHRTEKKRH